MSKYSYTGEYGKLCAWCGGLIGTECRGDCGQITEEQRQPEPTVEDYCYPHNRDTGFDYFNGYFYESRCYCHKVLYIWTGDYWEQY